MLKRTGIMITFALAGFPLSMVLDILGPNGGGVRIASQWGAISITSVVGLILPILAKPWGAYLSAGAWFLIFLGTFVDFGSGDPLEFGFFYPVAILGFAAMVFMLVVALGLQDDGRT